MSVENSHFISQFSENKRAGREKKFILKDMMPKSKTEILMIPLSEGLQDKREGKIARASVYSLMRNTKIHFIFGKIEGRDCVAFVRQIPEELRNLKWRQIGEK